jgi:hypothetical protein
MAVNDKVYVQTTSEMVKNNSGTDYAPGKTLFVERGVVASEDSTKVFVNTPVGAGGGGGGGATTITPNSTTFTQTMVTLSTGGTAQSLIATNSSRKYIEIINISNETIYISFSGTATTDSVPVPVGSSWYSDSLNVPTNAISFIGATTGTKAIVITA